MQIDWVTITAQVVNFLVLVWLLKKFLYGPITRAMARREEGIRTRLREAEDLNRTAAAEGERLRQQQADLKEERAAILDKAEADARALAKQLEEEARAAVEQERRDWHRQVVEERDEFLRDLRIQTAAHVYRLTRRVLREMADADFEDRLAERFARELENLDEDARARLVEAAGKSMGVQVQSSIELTSAGKARIEGAIDKILPGHAVVHETEEELLLGLRLVVGGQTVEWSLEQYLEDLETAVLDKLAEVGAGTDKEAA